MRRIQEVLVVLIIIIWCSTFFYLLRSQSSSSFNDEERLELNNALNAITEVQKQNKQLRELVNQLGDLKTSRIGSDDKADYNKTLQLLQHRLKKCLQNSESRQQNEPNGEQGDVSKQREVLSRRVENDLVELWFSLKREMNDIRRDPSAKNIDLMMERLATQQQAALIDIEDLKSLHQKWRMQEAKELQDLVQSRFHYIQNPTDCANSRQLLCKLNKGCGFGCQVHHLAYCFMIAFGTERTLIVESKNWRYNSDGWEAMFQPVSGTCTEVKRPAVPWRGEAVSKDVQTVFLPIVDGLVNPPPYMPLGIPEDIADRLLRLHGNPSVWWTGQFMSYLMRPQQWLQEDLDAVEKSNGFKHPIVGIHVRRTDKVGTEAAFHAVEEYMKHAITWYDKYDLRLSKEGSGKKATRRIYLASDDPTVLPEARKKFPDYVFVGDANIADSAGLAKRYSKNSLRGVIIDIHLLSKCDYLSCTFSSQVCRLAYELMQTLHPDASSYFHSLDDIYYYGGQTGHEQKALYNHDGGGQEIDLHVGDVVGIAGNHWDGFSKGINKRTRQSGLYPSYKVEEIFRLVKYPTYSEMKRSR